MTTTKMSQEEFRALLKIRNQVAHIWTEVYDTEKEKMTDEFNDFVDGFMKKLNKKIENHCFSMTEVEEARV